MFTQWNDLEPMPGDWRVKRLDERIEAMTKRGIRPWLTMIRPPERAIPTPDVFYPHYEPFPFDDVQWRSAATYLARRYRGKLWGFEWLNEILQGNKTKDPVGDYLRFCKIGTEAVKAVDPACQIQMAGGLWPRNYRMDLLRAGIARYVDVLPIHYGQLEAIEEAKRDFRAGGGKRVSDNETARCLAVWNMPGPMALTNSVTQCEYVMRQCPGELVAGAEMIVYFGGWTAAAGNYSYLIDGRSPRPLAATLAVMGAKLGDAVPVGSAALGDGAVVHHFRKPDGSAVAFVMTSDPASMGRRSPDPGRHVRRSGRHRPSGQRAEAPCEGRRLHPDCAGDACHRRPLRRRRTREDEKSGRTPAGTQRRFAGQARASRQPAQER
jgi:hypothetical protein